MEEHRSQSASHSLYYFGAGAPMRPEIYRLWRQPCPANTQHTDSQKTEHRTRNDE